MKLWMIVFLQYVCLRIFCAFLRRIVGNEKYFVCAKSTFPTIFIGFCCGLKKGFAKYTTKIAKYTTTILKRRKKF